MTTRTCNATRRRAGSRSAGFTLVELLTVIAIIATMITILVPAVFKAMTVVKEQTNKGIVTRLAFACKGYMRDWGGMPPGVVKDPLSTGHSPAKISGCQNLRLALLGCSKSGSSLQQQDLGPANDMTDYKPSTTKRYLEKYDPSEVAHHRDLLWTNDDGTSGEIQVFVDTGFEPVRPILYYRMQDGGFSFDDNSVYCTQSGESSTGGDSGHSWSSLKSQADKAKEKFILVWAGADRIFFTDDDFASVGF